MFRVAPNSNQKLWRHQRHCSRRRRCRCCCCTGRHLAVFLQRLEYNNSYTIYQQRETLPSVAVAIKGAIQICVI